MKAGAFTGPNKNGRHKEGDVERGDRRKARSHCIAKRNILVI